MKEHIWEKAVDNQNHLQGPFVVKGDGMITYVLYFGLFKCALLVLPNATITYLALRNWLSLPDLGINPISYESGSQSWILIVFVLSALIEIAGLYSLVHGSSHKYDLKRLASLGIRTLVRSLPYLLLLLIFRTDPAWHSGLLILALLGFLVGYYYRSWERQNAYGLCFESYPTLSFSRFLGWFAVLFIWYYINLTLIQSRPEEGFRNDSVKANMHTFQTLVETYAVDWKGNYPSSLTALEQEARQNGKAYWKDFSNPFSQRSGKGLSYDEMTPKEQLLFMHKNSKQLPYHRQSDMVFHPSRAGLVLYLSISSSEYKIFGIDKSGRMIRHKDQPYVFGPVKAP